MEFSKLLKALTPYVAGEQPKDKKYIKLNTNENAYPPSRSVEEVLRTFDIGKLRLYPDPECMELKEALAEKYGAEPQNIFVGNGSDEILGFCFPAFFDADGAPVLFPDVTYSFYPVYADLFKIPYRTPRLNDDYTINVDDYIPQNPRRVGVRNNGSALQEIPKSSDAKTDKGMIKTDDDIPQNPRRVGGKDDNYTVKTDGSVSYKAAESGSPASYDRGTNSSSVSRGAAESGGNQGVIIANPNAPTGILLPVEGIRKILEKNPGRVVIVDEAYADFSGVSVVPLTKKYENLLVVRTFSKSYSLAGIRCGYAIGQKPLIDALNVVKNSFNSYTLDSLTIKIASAACKDGGYYDMINERIINIRDKAAGFLREIGFTVLNSSSNFLFVKRDGTGGEYLFSELRKNGILTRHFKGGRTEDFIRVTVGTERETEEFLKAIEKLI
jgi:histidinol-phosphate/aromatic aminotransferase/cobyric acid decarboxylase-like protein